MTLHTTRELLREAGACASRYKVFLQATRKAYKDSEPIPLTVALSSNGLQDTIWALRAVLPGEEQERDKLARLFACDCAEHVLPIFEANFPGDHRPRQAIETSRRFALGHATVSELSAASAWAASAAAWEVDRSWQTERLRWYLMGELPGANEGD